MYMIHATCIDCGTPSSSAFVCSLPGDFVRNANNRAAFSSGQHWCVCACMFTWIVSQHALVSRLSSGDSRGDTHAYECVRARASLPSRCATMRQHTLANAPRLGRMRHAYNVGTITCTLSTHLIKIIIKKNEKIYPLGGTNLEAERHIR